MLVELTALLAKKLPENLLSYLPKRWWVLGDVLLFTLPPELESYGEAIAEAFLQLVRKPIRTVLGKIGPTIEVHREPQYRLLAGDPSTETIHKELGCRFKLDAAKLTFSPGNHGERTRLLELTRFGEFIVDMFSCVGNLSLPLAVHRAPKKVVAAEINPLAFHYLQENIRLNNVANSMVAILGDNRVVLRPFEGKADRVLAGYLFTDRSQLRLALRLCKEGGILHYHEAVPQKELFKRPITRVKAAAHLEGVSVEILAERLVKKYAPGISHIVLDVQVFKK